MPASHVVQRESVALVQVSVVRHPSIGVQTGQLSATPCWSHEPVSHVEHCEVVVLVQVSVVRQRSICVHSVHVSKEP